MRILVIGAGSIGTRHAGNLAALGCEVVHAGWRQGPDVAALLAGCDGAVIATATDVRLPLVAACAAAGVPFYCEKPLAFRPGEIEEIARLAAPVAARSMVGFMMRYHAGVRRLAALDLRDAFRFAFQIGHDVTQWRANWRFADSYAARASGGGVLLDLCHEIDMAAGLFAGLALGAVSSVGHAAFPDVDFASHVALHCGAASGVVAMDYLCPRLVRRAQVDTPRLSAAMDFAAGRWRLATADGVADEDVAQDRNAMFLDAARDWLTLLRGGSVAPWAPTFGATLPVNRLIAQAWAARQFTGTVEKDMG
jgi:predicted dehydrogenase